MVVAWHLPSSLQGKVVSFPEVPGHPIVTDVAWFMRLLNLLQEQKDNVSLQNGARCKALAPDVPMFDLAIIRTVFGSEATSELVRLFFRPHPFQSSQVWYKLLNVIFAIC